MDAYVSLEQRLSKIFTDKILDEKYSFIYNSIIKDFVEFDKIYSRNLMNHEIDAFEKDLGFYFNSQMLSFQNRLKDLLQNTGLDVEIFIKESGFSEIMDVTLCMDINDRVMLGVSVDYFDEGKVYFDFELQPDQVKLESLIGKSGYYIKLFNELKE